MKKNNPLRKLPVYSPNSDVWKSIEGKLDAIKNDKDTSAANRLPDYKAPENTWNIVEKGLDEQKRNESRTVFAKIAATLIILIGFGFYLGSVFLQSDNYEISYTVEAEKEIFDISDDDLTINKNDFKELLAEHCSVTPEVCNNKMYMDLKQQLENIENEEKYLKDQLAMHKDLQIENYLVKIANEKLRIEKFMLNMFTKN